MRRYPLDTGIAGRYIDRRHDGQRLRCRAGAGSQELGGLIKLADSPEAQARFRRVRVQVYTQLDRFDQAVAECRALLKASSKRDDRYRVHQMLYEIYSLTQELDKAEAEVRWLIQADPAQPMNYNNLGYLLADRGKDLPQAEELVRTALRLERERKQAGPKLAPEENQDPEHDSAAIVDSLGWVLFRRGRVDAARQQLEKASTLPDGADDPVIWDHLGDVYFRLHRVDRAQAVWKKAVTLYESGTSRKPDDQYKQIKHKLKLLDNQSRR
jgi:tetratricopeptide (TPR) repeat protein